MTVSMRTTIASAVLLLASATLPVNAADDAPGLSVGAKAPDFSLPDQDGKSFKLSDRLKKRPVALVFFRSANW